MNDHKHEKTPGAPPPGPTQVIDDDDDVVEAPDQSKQADLEGLPPAEDDD